MPESVPSTADMREIRELPPAIVNQPEELPRIPGGWTEREWTIEGQVFRLTQPAAPDLFLEDPDVHAAFDRDEYMPYWAYLWPSALKMVATILKSDWPENAEVLEIGAGIGIVGLAGLARGLRVTISDYEPKAVELAMYNARKSGYTKASGLVLDWRTPPARQFPILWGCELLYEDRHHEPLLELTRRMLTQDGVAWFVDGGRMRAERFCKMIPEYGLTGQIFDENLQRLSSPRVGQYQLIEVRHQSVRNPS
ncbi:methyltransferase [Schlesneria sp. DSM 10557]|uniref:class I SAM-dependent methyltransferase n=1 Tax=Schlesneria sp. DSM 10557 TaxID=3044399 RepID=UPI00359FA9AB